MSIGGKNSAWNFMLSELFQAHPFLCLFAVIAFFIWLASLTYRIRRSALYEFIKSQGGEIISASWEPGQGFLDKSSSYFSVTFKNKDGKVKTSLCKSGILSGVFFVSEELPGGNGVVDSASSLNIEKKDDLPQPQLSVNEAVSGGREDVPDMQTLLHENQGLREEIARLREEIKRLRD